MGFALKCACLLFLGIIFPWKARTIFGSPLSCFIFSSTRLLMSLCFRTHRKGFTSNALISVLVFYAAFADSSSTFVCWLSLLRNSGWTQSLKFLPSFRSFALRKTQFSSECVWMEKKRFFLVNFRRSLKVDVFNSSAPSLTVNFLFELLTKRDFKS